MIRVGKAGWIGRVVLILFAVVIAAAILNAMLQSQIDDGAATAGFAFAGILFLAGLVHPGGGRGAGGGDGTGGAEGGEDGGESSCGDGGGDGGGD